MEQPGGSDAKRFRPGTLSADDLLDNDTLGDEQQQKGPFDIQAQLLLFQQQMMQQQQQMQQQQLMFVSMMERIGGGLASLIPQAAAAAVQTAASSHGPAIAAALPPSGSGSTRQKTTFRDLVTRSDVTDEEWDIASSPLKNHRATGEQMAAIATAGSELKSKLHLLMNAGEKLDHLKDRQVALNSGNIPTGMKPYKAPWQIPSLDEESPFAGKAITINIPAGATHNEARETLYMQYHAVLAGIDIDVFTHRKEQLSKDTSLQHFIQEVRATLTAKAHGIDKFTSAVSAPPGLLESADEEAGLAAAVRHYRNTVKSMATERAKRDEAQKKEEDRKKKELQRASELTPDQVVEERFRAIATNIMKESKNGTSPGAARGQNQGNGKGKSKTTKQQPKGKGKGKDKGKSKGKGKAAPQGKGKGNPKGSKGSEQPFWRKGGGGKAKGGAGKGKSPQ